MRQYLKITAMFFACVLSLAGCSAKYQALQDEKDHEYAALKQEGPECKEYGEAGLPRGRENAVKYHDCLADIVNRIVIPTSMFADIYRANGVRGRQIAEDYRDGKIDFEEYRSRVAENMKRQNAEVLERYNQQ